MVGEWIKGSYARKIISKEIEKKVMGGAIQKLAADFGCFISGLTC